jgi:hypothetical protein
VSEPDWTAVLRRDDGYRIQSPASASAVADVESAFTVIFPDSLRALYLTSDGLFDELGQWFVIWPLAQVRTVNQESWAFECGLRPGMLAFGDDGTGAPFCIPADGLPGVFTWSAMGCSATRLADDVLSFRGAWTSDSLPPH